VSGSDVRTIMLAAGVLGAVLATLVLTGCGASQDARSDAGTCPMPRDHAADLQARQGQRDGLFMVLGECESRAELAAPGFASLVYESCLVEHNLP
jgi:hypothetical protein